MSEEKANDAVNDVVQETATETANQIATAVAAENARKDQEANTTKTAAETAVALTQAAAAAAAVDASERERSFYQGVERWQTENTERLTKLEQGMTSFGAMLSEALTRFSAAQKPSIPPTSVTEEVNRTTVVEPGMETAPEKEVVQEVQKTPPKRKARMI